MSVVAIAPLHLLRIGSASAYGSEQRETGGEAVEEGLPTDRTDLARAERARDRQRTEELVDDRSVVVGFAEEPDAATVTGEEEGGRRVLTGEHLPQVLVGRGRVAHVELHRLADHDVVADDERAG